MSERSDIYCIAVIAPDGAHALLETSDDDEQVDLSRGTGEGRGEAGRQEQVQKQPEKAGAREEGASSYMEHFSLIFSSSCIDRRKCL